MSADPIDRLQTLLGHRFADRGLLERALSHGSAIPQPGAALDSNERLEFVGDRVLGLAIAGELYRRHPDAVEGVLARRLNALVRKETCAERALALGIDGALRLSHGEAQTGGRRKHAILADACEAVLAAVFLDAGYEAAEAVILRVWEPLIAADNAPPRDAKTALQEHLQAAGEGPPSYRVVEQRGPDHKPHFVVEVVSDRGVSARGEGSSKREAEQNAARELLVT